MIFHLFFSKSANQARSPLSANSYELEVGCEFIGSDFRRTAAPKFTLYSQTWWKTSKQSMIKATCFDRGLYEHDALKVW